MGIDLRLGIDWNDNLTGDQSFVDGPHIELIVGVIPKEVEA